jgi:tripartite-type tricarboxylate transporter receptor subunit TctC
MSISCVAARMFLVGLMVLGAGGASGQATSTGSGQAYPNKPLRIVINGVGGGTDIIARIIAAGISGPLGQNVLVDSRGVTVITADLVARAPPDGYTLLMVAGNLWTTPLIQKTNYDPIRDFSPISMVTSAPNLLVVHPSVPVKSVKELIALAKARPGELNYAIGALGGNTHLAGELFKSLAGVNIVGVPYKSSGPAITAVLGGEVQVMFPGATGMDQYFKSGKLRALGVCSSQPSALFPGIPTVAASGGLSGYESTITMAIFAPAKTPAAVVRRLNEEIVRFVNTPDTKARFLSQGVEAVGNSPEQLTAIMKTEMVRMGKLYKDIGMSAE